MQGIKNYLSDMDGVILKGTTLIPGAAEFVQNLLAQDIPFLILTNNSKYTQRDLQVRLSYMCHQKLFSHQLWQLRNSFMISIQAAKHSLSANLG